MANAKKRKQTPQSATLHDFFAKPSQTQAKKAKLQSNSTPTQKSRTKAKPMRRASGVPAGQEVIVIDSDEEIEAGVVFEPISISAKNARSRPSLGGAATPARAEASAPIKVQNSPFGEPYLLRDESTSARAATPFGQPTLLLEDPHVSAVKREVSPFGASTLLLSEDRHAPALDVSEEMDYEVVPEAGPPRPPMTTDNSHGDTSEPVAGPSRMKLDPDVEVIEIEDDWATGDDERDLVNADVKREAAEDFETGSVDVDLTIDDADTPLAIGDADCQDCPLCGQRMKGLSDTAIQAHVNQCIDAISPSPKGKGKARADIEPQSLCTLAPIQLPAPPLKEDDPENGANLFSRMMESHQENEAWKEASVAEENNYRLGKGHRGRRLAPFYKVLQGMPIAVDAFRYGRIPEVTAYFLTHAHSDHYTNLSSNWTAGPIYCSEGTANLIIHMLDVDPKWVHGLPMDVPVEIPDTGGVQVTLIEANHCPGSCLFLYEGPQTVNAGDSNFKSPFVGTPRVFRYLHCGDFRASPQHVLHPAIKGKRIDHCYLDTTYLDPKYCFPPQPQVIDACAELAKRLVTGQPLQDAGEGGSKNSTMDKWVTVEQKAAEKKDEKPGRVLVVVGTYSIGKERIVKAIARALQTQVYCDARKTAILRCQSDPELHALLTTDPIKAGIHLVPLAVIASDRLKMYFDRWKGHFGRAVGFRPTGWTYTAPNGTDMLPPIATVIARSQGRTFTHAQLSPMKNSSTAVQVYGVPYSEHSSFFELTCFALSLDWGKMIATVNVGSESSRKKMGKWIERWEAERKKRSSQVVEHRADDYW